MNVLNLVQGVIAPIAGVFNKRTARKQAQDAIKGKIAQAKENNATEITLKDAEWESLKAAQENETWKDEYVTIVITSPLVGILAGSVLLAFTGDARLLEGTVAGIKALSDIGVDMGELMYVVVIAAVSLKVWRAA